MINALNDEITKRSGELQAFEVRQQTMTTEHKRNVANLEARSKALEDSIATLKAQENELLNRNSELQQQVSAREAEAQDAIANLKRRENELDARERAIRNKERNVATQLRRNLT